MGAGLAPPLSAIVEADVDGALAEDLGPGDATAELLPDVPAQAWVVAKESGVIAGRPWFDACFRRLDPDVRLDWRVAEGDAVSPGTVLVVIAGRTRALVSAERPALNFLQTLSATATRTAEHVAALAGTRTRVLDTRKTLPGLRHAQKYAVRAGGGCNHRMGLYDAVMLKENHIHAAAKARHPELPLVIEVETLAELDEALATGCERILVDDFSEADLREAVRRADGKTPLEVSGGVTLERLPAIGATGVD